MRKRTRGALATLALALTLSGCGGENGSGVASAGGATGGDATGAAAEKSLDPKEMALKFAECMREHGVPMEDPKPGKGLVLKSKGIDQATVKKAHEACREYDPMEAGGRPDPGQLERNRKHAECMRKNGVEKFPDPEPNQRGIRIDREVGEDPDFEAAQKKCEEILQGGGK